MEKKNVRSFLLQTDENEDPVPFPAEPTTEASPPRQVVITTANIVCTCEPLCEMPDSRRPYPVVEPFEVWLLERSELLSFGFVELPALLSRVC